MDGIFAQIYAIIMSALELVINLLKSLGI